MRTRLLLALTATVAAGVAFAPASTAAPAPACDDTVGREVLTAEGLDLEIAAPAVTAPELAATADVTGEAITPHRSAHFLMTVDAAPYEQVKLTARITWADTPSDYDIYAYTYQDEFRYSLGTSNASNIDGGDTRIEQITATVSDCQRIDLDLRSWAGSPAQDLRLEVVVEPVGEPRTDVLARPADSRAELYLAGDRPGNLTPPSDTAGSDYPFAGTFSGERPTGNVPNVITRPVLGSTIAKNPFQPWWGGTLEDFPTVQGRPSALLWLSSPTQQQDPGTVFVQLFLNGQAHTVEIPGSELTPDVRPYLVEFEAVDVPVFDVSLQVSALPVVSPNAQSEHAGDANHTVWYDSVQYPSRLYLPVTATDAG